MPLLLFLLVGMTRYATCTSAGIISFTQTPSGAVAPGTVITFVCEARDATTADLFVNGMDVYSHPISGFNYSYNFIRPGEWNNSLTTTASIQHNNTSIECIAHGDVGGQVAARTLIITIAGMSLTTIVTSATTTATATATTESTTKETISDFFTGMSLTTLETSEPIPTTTATSTTESATKDTISDFSTGMSFTTIVTSELIPTTTATATTESATKEAISSDEFYYGVVVGAVVATVVIGVTIGAIVAPALLCYLGKRERIAKQHKEMDEEGPRNYGNIELEENIAFEKTKRQL